LKPGVRGPKTPDTNPPRDTSYPKRGHTNFQGKQNMGLVKVLEKRKKGGYEKKR